MTVTVLCSIIGFSLAPVVRDWRLGHLYMLTIREWLVEVNAFFPDLLEKPMRQKKISKLLKRIKMLKRDIIKKVKENLF